MADLTDKQAAQTVKVVGADSTGVEQTPVQSTSSGSLYTNLRDASGNAITTSTVGSSVGLDINVINPIGKATVSTSNSTTTPLTANATFTGVWEDVTSYGSVSAIIDTDQNSATDGVRFELSTDGINIDAVHQFKKDVAILPEGGVGIFPIKAKYFRAVYINGNQAQSFFRMQIIYHPFPAGPTNLIATQITDTSPALITRSVITGKTSSDGYVNVKVTPSGSLTVALGDITGVVGQNTMANSLPVTIASNQSSIPVQDVLVTGGQNRNQVVTTSASEALGAATILANRKVLTITPTDGIVYWGYTNGVTTSNGTPIFKNQTFTIAVNSNVHIYLIAASSVNCRISEGA